MYNTLTYLREQDKTLTKKEFHQWVDVSPILSGKSMDVSEVILHLYTV